MKLNLDENRAILSYQEDIITYINPYISGEIVETVEVDIVENVFDYFYDSELKLIENKQEFYKDFYRQAQNEQVDQMMKETAKTSFLETLDDSQAAKIPLVFEPWSSFIGKSLDKDKRIEYDSKLWKVRQDISVVLENQPP